MWDGPEGLQPFVTTNVHLTPRQVWEDYLRVAQARSGWQTVLDRYRIDTVIFDKNQQRSQARAMRRNNEQWRVAYEDRQAIVFVRRIRQHARNDETPDVEIRRDKPAIDKVPRGKVPGDSREATAVDSLGRKSQVRNGSTMP